MRLWTAAWALAGVLVLPPAISAQSLRQQCVTMVNSASHEALCLNIADAMQIIPPKLGIVLSGGNPVPGTASTLGMRLGALPRMSIAARASGAFVDVPQIEEAGSADDDIDFAAGTIAADASIGVFQGFALLPTVGGFGSLDLLGSLGVLLTRRDAFDSAPFTWAAGVRIGLLRESFTAPGVSLSAMYRKIGDVEYGNVDTGLLGGDEDAFFRISDYKATSLRAVVGKRFFGFGVAAGVGHDRYRSDILIRVREPTAFEPGVREISQDGLKNNRTSLFANVSYTVLLLSFVGEAGWQKGAGAIDLETDRKVQKGALFGGVAVRIGI